MATRLPTHLYRWLKGRVGRDYPNMNQAVIGELTYAKTHRDMAGTLSPRARQTSINEQLEIPDCL